MEQMVMTIFCMLQIISFKNTKCKLKIVRALAPGVTTLPGSATPAAFATARASRRQACVTRLFFQTAVDDVFDFAAVVPM